MREFWRLQAFVSLPIVMPWRVMTTISVSGPAGSGIAAGRGPGDAAAAPAAAARAASTGRRRTLIDELAAILPG